MFLHSTGKPLLIWLNKSINSAHYTSICKHNSVKTFFSCKNKKCSAFGQNFFKRFRLTICNQKLLRSTLKRATQATQQAATLFSKTYKYGRLCQISLIVREMFTSLAQGL